MHSNDGNLPVLARCPLKMEEARAIVRNENQQLSISRHRATVQRENDGWRKINMAQDLSKGPSSERNTGQGNQKLNFRCSDVGPKSCNWQVSGNSEDEILPKIEQHGREAHNLSMDENTRSKVRSAIHRQAA